MNIDNVVTNPIINKINVMIKEIGQVISETFWRFFYIFKILPWTYKNTVLNKVYRQDERRESISRRLSGANSGTKNVILDSTEI